MEVCAMATDKKAVTVYLDEHLYEWVATVAKTDGRSISNFIEHALASKMHPEVGRVIMASPVLPDRSEK
jgi:hypothetical protein